jgi:hypothetical protein
MDIMSVIEDIYNGNFYRQHVKHADKSDDYEEGYLDAMKHIMERLPMFSELSQPLSLTSHRHLLPY